MTQAKEMQQVFAPADDVLMSDAGELKVLMSMQQGHFVELNATGRAIWERLDGTATLAAIAADLQGVYDIPPEQCEAEVLQFVGNLRDHCLVEPRD